MKMLTEAEYEALQDRCRGLESPDDFAAAATELVQAALRKGVVLTIEQRPLRPLAMGHHETHVLVRKARAG